MKALITGASSGIGREMARLLSSKCTYMVLVGRDEERLKLLKEELSENPTLKIKTVSTDLSIRENCIRLHRENPKIDLLINNAGFGDTGRFDETSLEKEITMINTNITACHILTKLYLKDMKRLNRGHILNVASIAGFTPGPLMSTYYATKSYVVRLSEGIREELRKDKSNVGISILCPGPVSTNFEKTANVNFRFDGMSSYYVAKYALEHLNHFYIVPGIGIKAAKFALHLMPSSLASRIIYRMQSTLK